MNKYLKEKKNRVGVSNEEGPLTSLGFNEKSISFRNRWLFNWIQLRSHLTVAEQSKKFISGSFLIIPILLWKSERSTYTHTIHYSEQVSGIFYNKKGLTLPWSPIVLSSWSPWKVGRYSEIHLGPSNSSASSLFLWVIIFSSKTKSEKFLPCLHHGTLWGSNVVKQHKSSLQTTHHSPKIILLTTIGWAQELYSPKLSRF